MIYAIITCTVMLILGLVCSKYNIFAPSVITSGIWLVCVLLFLLMNHNLYPLTSKFYLGISIWVFCFSIASLLMQSLKAHEQSEKVPSQSIRNIYYYVSIVTFPLLLLQAYEVISIGFTHNWIYDLRAASVGIIKSIDPAEMSPFYVVIWLVGYLIELYYYSHKNKNRVIILGLLYFLFACITVSKTSFLTLFISTIFILFLKNKIKTKHIFIGILILFFFMEIVQGFRSRGKDHDVDRKGFISTYVLSNMPAFETVQPNSSKYWGENTFRIFYAVGYKLKLTDKKPLDPILPFIQVPVVTNTYTTLYPSFKDFGYTGIAFFAMFIGGLLGYIFKNLQRGNVVFIIIYACLLTALIVQFANEVFFTFFALQLKYIIVAIIPFMFKVKK